MDYMEIVLEGCTGEQDKYVDRYYGRKQKEAEEKGYSFEEFYDGCRGALQKISREIERIYNKRKANVEQEINLAIRFAHKDIEDQCRRGLDKLSLYDFQLDLSNLSNGKYSGHINQSNIDAINEVINNITSTVKTNAVKLDKELKGPRSILINILSEEEIKSLYMGFIKLKGITDSTDLDSFIWDFGGNKKPEPYKPYQWSGAKNLCAYFVEAFNDIILDNKKKNKRNRIKEFENIFNICDLRGAMNDYKKTGALPELYKEIDALIQQLKR